MLFWTGRAVSAKQHLSKLTRSLKTGFLSVNNKQIYFEHNGEENKTNKAVICIPGALGSCRSDFSYQLDSLSQDFHVVAFDPRGYGCSEKPRTFPMDFYHIDANDASTVMKKLGFNKYSVLGWSDGGIASLILAGENQHAVEKLVVWGCNSFVSQKDIEFAEKTKDLDQWSERMKAPLEAIYGKDGLKTMWHEWLDTYSKFNSQPNENVCTEYLPRIKCPTLIIHGNQDAMLHSVHPHYLHEHIKQSKLLTVEKGKHNLHMRYAKEFNALVTKFMKDEDLELTDWTA